MGLNLVAGTKEGLQEYNSIRSIGTEVQEN